MLDETPCCCAPPTCQAGCRATAARSSTSTACGSVWSISLAAARCNGTPKTPSLWQTGCWKQGSADFTLVDFHAEATSEKLALGYYLDGRVSALWGTHTHVPTADEWVYPHGTGYITDLA